MQPDIRDRHCGDRWWFSGTANATIYLAHHSYQPLERNDTIIVAIQTFSARETLDQESRTAMATRMTDLSNSVLTFGSECSS